MGCTSSTEVVTDHGSGQNKVKHKMGGSYPGNRRAAQAAYTPPASQFNSNGQATAHFVSYGGGNALVLVQDGLTQVQIGAKQPQYIQVTLPAGVEAGQKIHVKAPDGRLNEIIVPDGFGAGSTFTVEFAEEGGPGDKKFENYAPPPTTSFEPQTQYPTAEALPEPIAAPTTTTTQNQTNGGNYDDGFASGFNNPSFVPESTATASSANNYDATAYPSANDAKPVYSNPPTYSATTY